MGSQTPVLKTTKKKAGRTSCIQLWKWRNLMNTVSEKNTKPLNGRRQPQFQIYLLKVSCRYKGIMRLFLVLVCMSITFHNENKIIFKMCIRKRGKNVDDNVFPIATFNQIGHLLDNLFLIITELMLNAVIFFSPLSKAMFPPLTTAASLGSHTWEQSQYNYSWEN